MDEPKIDPEACRRLLGPHSQEFSEEQIEALLEKMYSLSVLIIEAYEEISSFDVTSLNPPDIEDFLRSKGWNVDADAPGAYYATED